MSSRACPCATTRSPAVRRNPPLPSPHPAGIHTVAPHAGLTGLPEGWSGILPDGCAPDTVSAGSGLPPELVPSTRASPGVRLKDEAIVGKPFNVQRWRPAFGIPLEHVETSERNGFEIPLVLCTLRDGLRRMGGLHEEGIFRLAPDAALCQSACEALNANAAVVPKVCSLVRRPPTFLSGTHISPPMSSRPRAALASTAAQQQPTCVRRNNRACPTCTYAPT